MSASIDEYLAGKDPDATERLLQFRDLVLACGEVDERVHRTEIAWARARVFAAAFIYSSRLEIALDLRRRIHHPQLREAFPTTKTVITHRLTITSDDQLDGTLSDLLTEAYETVGPGTRAR
ncbi:MULTISPECIES: DUF5655 domain-containing protein [unclassified Rhodococcus (in: high G+C Gram-positive bacteria)]|uniref:DUF5655 domain-containing protein n=1 Tax=unclassified Rhodococcus (in: high G+C Gram-positive bacteria) TaxID=192944 RepID=UPI001639DFC3|nr:MULTISPECIES: DUF5655 domain-containing protein [unclassified Rhodococcus (in: high G+C Gram-positive bacteria)]MBC2638644.1 hypothetical protein [Rhodococcus sp. 3A]MBC2896615.1 hypothetical protein [Rhodococcus sp. 4CII]